MNQNEVLLKRAKKSIPGGVNSPVRAFKSVGGTPPFIKSASGSKLFDEAGNEYIDYINSWGPMILGHAFEPIVSAIQKKAADSTSFGCPTVLEIEIAELIRDMVPNVDKIRMVNSGTEACMSAVRLARGYTGKQKIIKFSGCYHGHADCFLIEAGSGALTLGTPNSPGVSDAVAQDTLIANFNDLPSVQELMEKYSGQIAAIILEPIAGNMGCIPPNESFLQGIRKLCDQHNIVLIFDEVMTGFRVHKGGAQSLYNVSADLVTFGKIIGGGMPVGAFGGKEEIMNNLAPQGPVYQAGTLSGNPLAMIAGFTMLKYLNDHPEVYTELENKTAQLEDSISELIKKHNQKCVVNRIGSMISMHFTDENVIDFQSAMKGNNEKFKKFYHFMLNKGIYLPPSPFESWFISTAVSDQDIQHTVDSIEAFFIESSNEKVF